MKKSISILSLFLLIGIYSVSAQCCSNTAENVESLKSNFNKTNSITKVQVYYFHATRRCATCQAVEAVTDKALKELYGDKVSFNSINREIDKDNTAAKKHKISGQTLLIVKDDKVVNLTNYAFMNARTYPDKLKAKIKESIDSML